jgi:hypothetical protein
LKSDLGRAARQLAKLAQSTPSSPSSGRARASVERLLMRILTAGGPRALERVVAAARLQGLDLQQSDRRPGYRAWQNEVLSVRGFSSRAMRYISVQWAVRRPSPTPAQQRLHRTQEAFYARYMAAGRRAYASPPQRISANDRCILLVGELEAEVNNGGFDQYLDNKGRRRAGEALRALRRIGATATARLLEAAMKPGLSDAARSRLDKRFYESKENLPLSWASRAGRRSAQP